MSTNSDKSIGGKQPDTKPPSVAKLPAGTRVNALGVLGNRRARGALQARLDAAASASTASAGPPITKITFDKTSLKATYYLEDPFGLRTVTSQVLDHSDPAPGIYVAEVFRDSDGRRKWKLPRGSSAQPGKGFIFVTEGRVPGTLEGVSQIEVVIIDGAAGEFLSMGGSSRSAPMDAEARARVGEKLLQAGVTEEDLDLYHAGISEPALNEGDFERAVDAFLEKRRAQREARDTEMSNLAHAMDFVSGPGGPGAEVAGGSGVDVTMVDIYKEYQVYLRSLSGSSKEFSRDEALKLPRQAALESKLQERYGIGLPEFEKRIGVFEQAFRGAIVNLAFATLDQAEGICNRYLRELPEAGTLGVHEQPAQMVRTLDPVRPSIAAELEDAEQKADQARHDSDKAIRGAVYGFPSDHKAIQARIAAAEKAEKAALDRIFATLSDFPVAQLPGFPSRKLLKATSADDAAYVVNWYLLEHIAGIKAVREQLVQDSKRIYKLDSLLELAMKQFGFNVDTGPERSIFKLIIGDEVRRASEMTGWQQLELAFEFSLMVISIAFPGAVVVTVPLLATTSIHEGWVGVTDYREDHAASQVGFRAQDPSTFWLIFSLIGAAFDAGDIFRTLHRLPELGKAIEDFSRTLNLRQLADALDKVPGLDPKAAAAIVKRAQTRPPEGKVTPPSYGNIPLSTPLIDRIDSPYPYPLMDPDYQPGVAHISDGSGGPKGDGPVPPKNTSPVEAETPSSQKPQSKSDVEDVDPREFGAEPLEPKDVSKSKPDPADVDPKEFGAEPDPFGGDTDRLELTDEEVRKWQERAQQEQLRREEEAKAWEDRKKELVDREGEINALDTIEEGSVTSGPTVTVDLTHGVETYAPGDFGRDKLAREEADDLWMLIQDERERQAKAAAERARQKQLFDEKLEREEARQQLEMLAQAERDREAMAAAPKLPNIPLKPHPAIVGKVDPDSVAELKALRRALDSDGLDEIDDAFRERAGVPPPDRAKTPSDIENMIKDFLKGQNREKPEINQNRPLDLPPKPPRPSRPPKRPKRKKS